jgi:hypothetical protein
MDSTHRLNISPVDSTKLGSGQIRVEEEDCARSIPADDLDRRVRLRRVNRKIDLALLPFLSALYLFNGLDRSNVGNAETQGELTSSQVH